MQEASEAIRYVYETLDARIGIPPLPEDMRAAAYAAGIPGAGTPAGGMRILHIAGTNGKGSTAAMLESMLRAAGRKTGLFTSPHLLRLTERIRVNGAEIAEEMLPMLLEAALQAEGTAGARLNYFSLMTLMALICFVQENCEYCILEAGLGGRLDPTNCMDVPELAILTRIGVDHMALLGNTLEEITREKAGIIKRDCDVVLAVQAPEVTAWITEIARARQARLHAVTGTDAPPQWAGQPLELGLRGVYQYENAATALLAIQLLQKKGARIPDEAVREGMRRTQWPGRFERIGEHILADGAHNPQGAHALQKSLRKEWPGKRHIFVMGFMADKAYADILEQLAPLARAMIAVPAAETERALPADALQKEMKRHCKAAYAASSLEEGLALAERLRTGQEWIVVCGSLYLAGEAKTAAEGCRGG